MGTDNEIFQVGDLVDIYAYNKNLDVNIGEVGLVLAIKGYKIDVLRSGKIEVWDKRDIENMIRWKREELRAHRFV